ncbi:MAG: oxygen-independent coproporphyrinogen III oxidase, partial [Pyrinomonadaceae bacterium]
LRMNKGVDLAEYNSRFQISLSDKYREEIAEFLDLGLIEFDERHMRLTRKGRLYSNEVFAKFI